MTVDLVTWLVNNGFAVAVTCFLLYERSQILEKVSINLEKLTDVILQCQKK